MSEFENKEKYILYARPETIKKAESLFKDEGAKSRSEFIEHAINFYCGYLTAVNYKEYFPEIVIATMKGMMDSFENRMAKMMFKYAVELSMLMHVVASDTNIDENTLTKLRGKCVRDVKCAQGMISFDEALKYQRGE